MRRGSGESGGVCGVGRVVGSVEGGEGLGFGGWILGACMFDLVIVDDDVVSA